MKKDIELKNWTPHNKKTGNDIIIEKENLINIFFCSNEDTKSFSKIKSFLMNLPNKFRIKGEYNTDSIIDEICFYLGILDKDHEEIDEKEIRNIIIFNIPFNEAEKILQSFLDKVGDGTKNDDYPFFVFLKNNNLIDNFDIKKLLFNLNDFQKNIIDSFKIDSRNIYIDTEETIIYTIKSIYNYYNGDYTISFDDNENERIEKYNITKTINILVMGKRGSGKSALINRLLGEKKAYADVNAKTIKTREYFHKYYPLKFIDSAGFQVGGLEQSKTNEILDINKYLEENNLTYKNIKKKVHFIFYVFKNEDKFDDSIIQILKKLESFKIEIFFIITYSTEGKEKMYKNDFKSQIKKNKIFPKEKINDIINNTFCLDLFNIYYSKTISEMILLINGKLKEYKDLNDSIIDLIGNNNLIKTKELGYSFNFNNEFTPIEDIYENESLNSSFNNLSIIHESPRGKIFNHYMNSPEEIIKMMKFCVESNIFLTDPQSDRQMKKNLSKNIIKNFIWPGFWWSSISFFGELLSKKSKMKMINRISEIYEIQLPQSYIEDEKKEFLDSAKKEDSGFKKFIYKIGGLLAGIWNKNNVIELGEQIIEEFDFEYSKKNIFDLYVDMAKKYNESFEILENFYNCFNKDYWYDIKLEE